MIHIKEWYENEVRNIWEFILNELLHTLKPNYMFYILQILSELTNTQKKIISRI